MRLITVPYFCHFIAFYDKIGTFVIEKKNANRSHFYLSRAEAQVTWND
jgi:hypothetical protein